MSSAVVPAKSSACCSTSSTAFSSRSGGYSYLARSRRTLERIAAFTLSLRFQSIVALERTAHEFSGNRLERFVTQLEYGRVVLDDRVVEGDLVLAQAKASWRLASSRISLASLISSAMISAVVSGRLV